MGAASIKSVGFEESLLPVDRLLLGSLAVLAMLGVCFLPRPLPFLGVLAATATFLLGVAMWGESTHVGRVLHAFISLPVVLILFTALGPLIPAVNPVRWDDRWRELDQGLFGNLAWHWHHALGRPSWFTDASYLVYVSYYALPVALGAALYIQHRRGEFHRFVFTTVATFLLSYVGYFLFPTLGPRVPVELEDALLGGGAISHAIRAFLLFSEGTLLNAFPSAHTAVSLVLLGLGWRAFPRMRVPLTLHVAAIIFTTVYLSFHYVVDLMGGVMLALMTPVLVPMLRRLCGPAGTTPRGLERHVRP
ncbi:phosphatase PAP2 family protein [Vitiosangium sp. GDMCC 1.1324]|uniref:phosphatase PAP2 family protein n=1 Tax=Vitiosangium sp. (strain GDMCC 1.1324) TaxID=2138576 RepID=UPI00130EBED3|nr:phosphatase PAP2 family protein [Vitiosangium sp. GDMCC 1.1324]